jgi:hypothetical protein
MIEDFENFIQTDESFLVVLDSRNATTDYSQKDGDNSNLSFKLQTPIIQPVNAINMKAAILNFTCPNSQYIINETNNSFGLSFNIAGTPLVSFPSYEIPKTPFQAFYITIQNGNYTAYTFMTALINSINILSNRYESATCPSPTLGIFSMSFDTVTSKFTISNDRYYFYISQNVIFQQFFNDYFPSNVFYTIGDVIGFDNTSTYVSSPVLNSSGNVIIDSTTGLPKTPYSITFPYPVNFGGLQNINIHFENFKTYNVPYESKNLILKKNNLQEFSNYSKANIACSIPVKCSPMEVINYEKIGTYAFTVKDEQIDTITIALRDDLGNLLRLNGQNWNMTIEFILTKHTERRTRNFYSILNNPYPVFE